MHANVPKVLIWPNQDIFKHGILAGFPSTFATVDNVFKFLLYCRSKGKNGWPNVCYAIWESYAGRYFDLDPRVANLYFESCRHTCLNIKETSFWDDKFNVASSDIKARMKEKVSVNAIHLALYLYSQNVTLMQTQRFSLRSEEFPTDKRNKKKSIDVRFIETFISDIIKIICDPESKGLSLDKQPLSLNSVAALSVMFTVYTENSIMSLHEVLQQQAHATSCSFNKLTQSFSTLHVRSWLLDRMHANPFNSKRCLYHGKPIYLKPGRPLRRSTDQLYSEHGSTLSRSRIMVNDHETPDQHRMLAMQYVSRQTIALSSDIILNHRVHVTHCNDAFLYFLSSIRGCTVKQSSRTTLVTGPISGTLYMTGCVNMNVISISRRVVLRNCHGCKLYILTPTRPLLLAGCADITVAPYNTYYGSLPGHLSHANFSVVKNLWNFPATPMSEDSKIFQVLPPENFNLFSVPFQTDGTANGLVHMLPLEYEAAVNKTKDRVTSWYDTVQKAELSDVQTTQLASTIQARFHDWLECMGHTKELESLAKYRDRS